MYVLMPLGKQDLMGSTVLSLGLSSQMGNKGGDIRGSEFPGFSILPRISQIGSQRSRFKEQKKKL